jgi:hypothetical protein
MAKPFMKKKLAGRIQLLESAAELGRFVDPGQVTAAFGGTLPYAHAIWCAERLAAESAGGVPATKLGAAAVGLPAVSQLASPASAPPPPPPQTTPHSAAPAVVASVAAHAAAAASPAGALPSLVDGDEPGSVAVAGWFERDGAGAGTYFVLEGIFVVEYRTLSADGHPRDPISQFALGPSTHIAVGADTLQLVGCLVLLRQRLAILTNRHRRQLRPHRRGG